jgi:AraC-like DNA-binding protein
MAAARAPAKAGSLGFWVRTGFIEPMRSDHAHADIELNFVFAGGLRYFFGGRFVEVPPGRLAAMWAAIPHQAVQVEPRTEIGWVCIPLADFLRWDLRETAFRRLLRGDLVVDGHDEPLDAERVRQWAAEWGRGDAYEIRTVALEVEARVRRLLRGGAARAPLPATGASSRVEEIAGWLGEHYREDLTLKAIGAAVGLNPNYAMTVFRAGCGMSIWRYVTRLRLAHAQRLLATTDRTALAIAMESGFGSLNRFYESFRAEFGMPPGQFRKRAR